MFYNHGPFRLSLKIIWFFFNFQSGKFFFLNLTLKVTRRLHGIFLKNGNIEQKQSFSPGFKTDFLGLI
jgi:hypothetical protein